MLLPPLRTALRCCLALLAAGALGLARVAGATPPGDEAEKRQLEEELQRELAEDPAAQPSKVADPPTAVATGSNLREVLKGLIPDISFILDVAGAYFSSEPMQTGAHDPAKTGFTFQQLELHVESSVDPYFRMETNIVFAEFGVEVEEAYASTSAIPGGLEVRVGQFLIPFGRLNGTHPHAWKFADQPLVNGKFFGGEASRGLGAEISWLAPLPWYFELGAAMTEPAGECCARSFYGGSGLEVEGFEDFVYTNTLKQFFDLSEDWGLSWGLSAQLGPNPTGQGNRSEIYGTDLYLRYRPAGSTDRVAVSLQTEGMFRARQVPGDVLYDWGLYAQLIANLTPAWELGARYDFVSGVDGDYLDPLEDAPRHRASLQVTLYPSHFSRVRLQGNYDAPQWNGASDIWAAILNVEFLIGAHGGHDY